MLKAADIADQGFHEYDIGGKKARLDTFRWADVLVGLEDRFPLPPDSPGGEAKTDAVRVARELVAAMKNGVKIDQTDEFLVQPVFEADAEVSDWVGYNFRSQIEAEFSRLKKNTGSCST